MAIDAYHIWLSKRYAAALLSPARQRLLRVVTWRYLGEAWYGLIACISLWGIYEMNHAFPYGTYTAIGLLLLSIVGVVMIDSRLREYRRAVKTAWNNQSDIGRKMYIEFLNGLPYTSWPACTVRRQQGDPTLDEYGLLAGYTPFQRWMSRGRHRLVVCSMGGILAVTAGLAAFFLPSTDTGLVQVGFMAGLWACYVALMTDIVSVKDPRIQQEKRRYNEHFAWEVEYHFGRNLDLSR